MENGKSSWAVPVRTEFYRLLLDHMIKLYCSELEIVKILANCPHEDRTVLSVLKDEETAEWNSWGWGQHEDPEIAVLGPRGRGHDDEDPKPDPHTPTFGTMTSVNLGGTRGLYVHVPKCADNFFSHGGLCRKLRSDCNGKIHEINVCGENPQNSVFSDTHTPTATSPGVLGFNMQMDLGFCLCVTRGSRGGQIPDAISTMTFQYEQCWFLRDWSLFMAGVGGRSQSWGRGRWKFSEVQRVGVEKNDKHRVGRENIFNKKSFDSVPPAINNDRSLKPIF